MKTLRKIAEEQVICRLLFNKNRTRAQTHECSTLLREYQSRYDHPFPISVVDNYLNELFKE